MIQAFIFLGVYVITWFLAILYGRLFACTTTGTTTS